MSSDARAEPPTAEQVARRLRSLPVRATRPMVTTGLAALRVVCRYQWHAEGLEHLRDVREPVLFAANHMSHADTAAICDLLPRDLCSRTAVAAALDVFGRKNATGRTFRNEALQLLVAAGFHAYAFDRHGKPRRSVQTTLALLRTGWNVLLYPEGTRSRTGKMGQFKAGVGLLARFGRCPVVPIHVHGGQGILPHGVMIPRNGRVVVRFGSPLDYRADDTPDVFAHRLRDTICRLGEETAHQLGTAFDQVEVQDLRAARAR
ncbi:MAG: lysophospholipid acyltransferase family protein [Planctomycetota bacterium]|jgi:1-acyl-sn-glycerol-3-phosphate acyltransferase